MMDGSLKAVQTTSEDNADSSKNDFVEVGTCTSCRFYFRDGFRCCGICNKRTSCREPLFHIQPCPLCTQATTLLASGLPVPQRIRTSILCRGNGERMGSEKSQPMALPNGQVYSKKFIFDNSYVLTAEADVSAILSSAEVGKTSNSKFDGNDSDGILGHDDTEGDEDDGDSVVSVNSLADSLPMTACKKYELLTKVHWDDPSKVYFTCPVSGENFSLDLIRPVFIT
jgi:hypothetical protein